MTGRLATEYFLAYFPILIDFEFTYNITEHRFSTGIFKNQLA